MATHEIDSTFYPGTHGDRPTPWQRSYECLCGEDLGFDEEGSAGTDVASAFEDHLADCGDTA